jgi:two-component system, chemotaxis family, sensor kinase CheA
MKACEPHAVLLKAMKDWLLEPTAPRLHRVAEQTKRLAQRLDKGDLQIEIIDNGTRLDPQRFAPIWSSFVHAIRNAVDHGIEGGDERVAAGKTSNGTIRITTRLEGFDAVIEVSDDGRGIDWTRVAACAAELNLPATTPEELEAALFFDGLSTASEVAEISGRGVGMGALRAACAELGGSLHVSSERGKGTTIQARIPVAIQGQSIAPMAAE